MTSAKWSNGESSLTLQHQNGAHTTQGRLGQRFMLVRAMLGSSGCRPQHTPPPELRNDKGRVCEQLCQNGLLDFAERMRAGTGATAKRI